jgi:hypothetical protein
VTVNIIDPETEARVRALAKSRSGSLTEAVSFAVTEALTKAGVPLPELLPAKTKLKGDAALEHELDRRIRSDTLKYTRLRNEVLGTKGGGSRIYQMLRRHGPVETLRRLVMRPTDGLKFLVENDAIDISAEKLALEPRFASILPEDIRIRARANLAVLGL